jgi:hypothetical protein
MGRKLLVLVAVLLAVGLLVAGCRKSSGGGNSGYLPAPTRSAPAAVV